MPDVIGIGSTFVDYFFEADDKFLKDYKLKPEDDLLFSDKKIKPSEIEKRLKVITKSPGGISTNTIAVLSRLKVKTSYYGILGNDDEAKFWKNNLKEVSTSNIKKSGHSSVCFCILNGHRRHRLFISTLNRSDNKFFKDINYSFLNKTKIIHISPFLLNTNSSVNKLCKTLGKLSRPILSFSPGMIWCILGIEKLKPLIKHVDIIFLNENEMKYLVNKPPKTGSKLLLNLGPKTVVCTMGANGVLVSTNEKQIFIPARKVKKIIDSTGAGDAFAAGFLFGVLNNKSLEWSAKFGNKIASYALSGFGLSWLDKKIFN